jgi:hypothetical protein
MAHRFRALKLMGFSALVLSVMGLGSAVAKAEPGAFWKVNGAALNAALSVQVQASLENNHGILLTNVGATKVEVLCTTIKFTDALLKTLGGLSGKIHFEGCITKLNGSTATACVPHSPGVANGLVETNALDGLIILHEDKAGARVDQFELLAGAGAPFVTLILGKAAPEKNECAIGEKFEITGKTFLKDTQSEGLVEKTSHLVEEGPLSGLKFGTNPMTLDGSITVTLVGAHEGMKWSGVTTKLGSWKINGAKISDELKAQVQAALENNDGSLLTKIGLTKLELLCTSVKLVDGLLQTLGGFAGKFHYEGCIFKINGTTSPVCKPHSPGAAEGLIETNSLKGLIQLHEVEIDLFKLVPASGTEFLTLVFGKEIGSECALFSKLAITGQIFLEDTQSEGLVEKTSHLVEEGPLSLIQFGGNVMTLDGSATVVLTGAHAGMKWSGTAS